MRKQRINTLWRKVRPAPELGPIYFRNYGLYHLLSDPEDAGMTFAQLEAAHGPLTEVVIENPCLGRNISPEEVADWVHAFRIDMEFDTDGDTPLYVRAGS
jgi:hypothetical protein